jgi:hypothetical protein
MALGVVVVGVAGAMLLRVLAGLLLRPWPRAHDLVARHGLWVVFPVILVYLLVEAWQLAVVALVLSPLTVMVIRRVDLPFGTPRSARPRP